jgi:transcriptional regulator with XRE-family HTH domain
MSDSNSPEPPNPDATETCFRTTEIESQELTGAKIDLRMIEEDSEATIRRILSSYDLGAKLRHLRLKKKVALVDLGKHTGLSASMLSQLENGKLVPTLPTLARIAMVFDVGLDHFFSHRKRKGRFSIVRAADRMQFPDRPGATKPNYLFECLAFSASDKTMQAFLAEFPKRAEDEVQEHAHEGGEFVHVLDGTLVIRYDDEEHVLRGGDSVYFDGSQMHSYRGTSKVPARAVVITTPPQP